MGERGGGVLMSGWYGKIRGRHVTMMYADVSKFSFPTLY